MSSRKEVFAIQKRRFSLRDAVFLGLLLILVGIGAWSAFDTVRTNDLIRKGLGAPAEFASPEERQAAEGRDESDRDNTWLDTYQVSADLPRTITADSIGMKARVLQMDVNPDGSMQAPINIFDSGWYVGSSKPGEKGAVVVDGHASGPTREGLFAYIDTLKPGEVVSLERGDGRVFRYEVVHVETAALEDVNMKKLLTPYEGVESGLNLITCAGSWLAGQSTYDQRAMVYTKLIADV